MSFSDFIGICLLGMIAFGTFSIWESRRDFKRLMDRLEKELKSDDNDGGAA